MQLDFGHWPQISLVLEMPKADTRKIQKNWKTPLSPGTEMTIIPYTTVKCIKDTS